MVGASDAAASYCIRRALAARSTRFFSGPPWAMLRPRLGSPTFIISLDFELFWGVRDVTTLDRYGANLRGVRDAIPAMLRLFSERGIRATWATVGFLFF